MVFSNNGLHWIKFHVKVVEFFESNNEDIEFDEVSLTIFDHLI